MKNILKVNDEVKIKDIEIHTGGISINSVMVNLIGQNAKIVHVFRNKGLLFFRYRC